LLEENGNIDRFFFGWVDFAGDELQHQKCTQPFRHGALQNTGGSGCCLGTWETRFYEEFAKWKITIF